MSPPRLPRGAAIWITLFSLAWAAALWTDALPILRGGFGWDWKYKPVTDLPRLVPLIAGVIIYAALALWLVRRQATAALLAWAVAGGVFLSLAGMYLRGDVLYRLYSLTASGMAGGFQMASTRISDVGSTLQHWPAFMQESVSFSTHMGISPPGLVLVYYGATRLLQQEPAIATTLAQPLKGLLCQYVGGYSAAQSASAWLGILMPVWGSLTVLPLYPVARSTFGRDAATWSVAWWPLIPGFLSFAPGPNTAYGLPALILIGLLMLGLRRNQMLWVFASGAVASALTFLTFTFLPLLLFAGLLTLGFYWWRKPASDARTRWYWPLGVGGWFAAGLSLAWIAAYAIWKVNLWAIWSEAQRAHLNLDRPYWPWLGLHLNDFFMFTGWPITLLAGAALWMAAKRLWLRQGAHESDIVIAAAALTILALDLSGTLRGESGRILLFLSPWLLFAAAQALQGNFRLGGIVTLLQGLSAVVLLAALLVERSEFKAHAAPQPPAGSAAIPANAQRYTGGSRFGEAIELASYAAKVETQGGKSTLLLWLTWRDLQPTTTTYDVSLKPTGTAPALTSETLVTAPFDDAYPTACWKPNDGAMTDRVRIALDPAGGPPWTVQLVLVDRATHAPAATSAAGSLSGDAILLGPFH